MLSDVEVYQSSPATSGDLHEPERRGKNCERLKDADAVILTSSEQRFRGR